MTQQSNLVNFRQRLSGILKGKFNKFFSYRNLFNLYKLKNINYDGDNNEGFVFILYWEATKARHWFVSFWCGHKTNSQTACQTKRPAGVALRGWSGELGRLLSTWLGNWAKGLKVCLHKTFLTNVRYYRYSHSNNRDNGSVIHSVNQLALFTPSPLP